MKTAIYFKLAFLTLRLASLCRICGIKLDYYHKCFVTWAIYSSPLPLVEKDELLRKFLN
jgi:hypothetical protein